MTAGKSGIPIKNFEDVIHHGYKVVTHGDFYKSLLANAGPGSAKHQVYKMHLENAELWTNSRDDYGNKRYEFLRDLRLPENSKTLLYTTSNMMRSTSAVWNKQIINDLFALKMEDMVKLAGGHVLQKDSEFLPIFNHYLVKQFENGLVGFSLSTGGRTPNGGRTYGLEVIPIGMTDPEPMPFNSIQSAFIFFGVAVFTSIAIAACEFMSKQKPKKPKDPKKPRILRSLES